MKYKHTQSGLVGPLLFAIVSVVLLSVAIANDVALSEVTGLLVLMVPLGLVLLYFNWLTISVEDQRLEIAFGAGWFRKRIQVEEIQTLAVVRTKWWYGFGLRLTPDGWMYNVAGLDAVRLDLVSGKSILVGTDEPQTLAAFLNEAGVQWIGKSRSREG